MGNLFCGYEMNFVRNTFLLTRKEIGTSLLSSHFKEVTVVNFNRHNLSTMQLTKNLELLTNDKKPQVSNLKLIQLQNKPLVVMLSWMLANRKHVLKFVDYYTERGFDVLKVSITPWQLLWPVRGAQVVAKDILTFLDLNIAYNPLFIHGFSVGGYQWGEVLVHISNDQKKYQKVADRIVGQVWDSAADLSEISFGFPMAVFPKNLFLQNAMTQYMLYHLKAFDKIATCHYARSSQIFHSNLVKAPALFLLSKSDPVGAEKSNQRLREDWEQLGVKVYWKCWDKSPHVGHFHFHKKEYLEQLEGFLSNLGLLKSKLRNEQLTAKL